MYDLRSDTNNLIKDMLDVTMGLPTGIHALDQTILGFSPGELIIIAGRPSMGKSSLARDIALSIGRTDATVLYSLEMNYQEIAELLLVNLAKVDYHAMKRDGITDSVKARLDSAKAQLSTYNILINDETRLTPAYIHKELTELNKHEPISCIIVDYLQLMSLGGLRKRQEEVTEISRQLKAIAKEFNIPVIAVSQLNRDLTKRESPRPRLEDLRESGSLEQDASKVLLIHRPSYFDFQLTPDAIDTGEAEIIVAKNRKGPRGIIKCVWVYEWTSFMNIPEDIQGF